MTTRLLKLPEGEDPPLPPACEALVIGGVTYRHSAAKFWPRLIDEALTTHPACTRLELATLTPEPLDPLRLDPQAELQRDVEALAQSNLQDVIRDSISQLRLYGPPGLIRVRLLAGGQLLYGSELPADCADAEVFLYLAAWLLEWARIPHADWNRELLEGQFVAQDRRRRLAYHVRFDARREHVSEGLFRLVFALDPRVNATVKR